MCDNDDVTENSDLTAKPMPTLTEGRIRIGYSGTKVHRTHIWSDKPGRPMPFCGSAKWNSRLYVMPDTATVTCEACGLDSPERDAIIAARRANSTEGSES